MEKMKVTPHYVNVLAEVTVLPTEVNGVYVGEQSEGTMTRAEFYYGTALKKGPLANEKDQCPELEEGDGIIFNQFAGHHVATDDGFCKVLRGHDIVAIVSDLTNMNEETIKPTGDRILVRIIGEELISEDGVYDDTSEDPRDLATQKGLVISCGPNAEQIEAGTTICFDPYCGNLIVNEANKQLKTINSFDVLFSLGK
jgi:co-chaperonin GroES (HSP10)